VLGAGDLDLDTDELDPDPPHPVTTAAITAHVATADRSERASAGVAITEPQMSN
jgi:hypothetical protein